jgi:hypothetical protein
MMKKQLLSSLNRLMNETISNNFNLNEDICDSELNSFELDISWRDISESTYSNDNNIIVRSMKRNGFNGKVTSSSITLDNGNCYVPQQLSDHWEVYNDSPKIKPINIKYIKS